MKKSFLYFLFLFGILSIAREGNANTIHAILVADTIHDITNITKPDVHEIHKELQLISKYTQMPLKEVIFTESEFCMYKLSEYLQYLILAPSDIVIFHFSGHGYRTRYKTTPWPYLAFDFDGQAIDLQWIADTIRKKKPQFALIIADCCNNYIERGFGAPCKDICITAPYKQSYFQGYRPLFKEAKGCIIIASCSAGEFSYGSRFGGLYTHFFLSYLNQELGKANPSWQQILQRTSASISHIQKPVYITYN